jgi:serine/threonine protein kinase
MADIDPKGFRGNYVWESIEVLSSDTGQGNVWTVAKIDPTEPIERILKALRSALSRDMVPEEDQEKARRELFDGMRDFAAHRYTLGALKQLKRPDDSAQQRLRTEAALYETISDPHLVAILDKNLSANWIVTEYQPNKTLEDRLASFEGDAIGTLKAIRPVVNVLARLHSKNFVHRDFKPGNIFIGRREELILGDAGLAFSDTAGRVTETLESVGTQHYMPAWAQGRRLEEIKPSFDVFSVGKVIWAMVAGRPTCPLWYCRQPENDLTRRFPDRSEMAWINRLLEKCVVEFEHQMQIQNATDLLAVIDTTIRAIEAQAIPPELTRSDSVLFPCRICSVGDYVPSQVTELVGQTGRGYQCTKCGHFEFFIGHP